MGDEAVKQRAGADIQVIYGAAADLLGDLPEELPLDGLRLGAGLDPADEVEPADDFDFASARDEFEAAFEDFAPESAEPEFELAPEFACESAPESAPEFAPEFEYEFSPAPDPDLAFADFMDHAPVSLGPGYNPDPDPGAVPVPPAALGPASGPDHASPYGCVQVPGTGSAPVSGHNPAPSTRAFGAAPVSASGRGPAGVPAVPAPGRSPVPGAYPVPGYYYHPGSGYAPIPAPAYGPNYLPDPTPDFNACAAAELWRRFCRARANYHAEPRPPQVNPDLFVPVKGLNLMQAIAVVGRAIRAKRAELDAACADFPEQSAGGYRWRFIGYRYGLMCYRAEALPCNYWEDYDNEDADPDADTADEGGPHASGRGLAAVFAPARPHSCLARF